MGENVFWDKNIDKKKFQKVLKDESHPRFIEFIALFLSRTNEPKEVFTYLDKVLFCKHWRRIKRTMRKNKWNDAKIIFWEEVYRVLSGQIDKKKLAASKERYDILNENAKKIGEAIKNSRHMLGWTQHDLAAKAALSQQTISFAEKGYLNISLNTLTKICDALDLDVYVASKDKVLASGKGEFTFPPYC